MARAIHPDSSPMSGGLSADGSSPLVERRAGPKKPINLRFGFLVHDVARLRRVLVDRTLKSAGITRSQWEVLAFLSRGDGMTQTALAETLNLTKSAIGALLDRMAKLGFVERRVDQRDSRIKRVYLTTAAKFLGTIRTAVQDVEQKIIADVGDYSLQVTAETLIIIKRNLLKMIGDDTVDADGD